MDQNGFWLVGCVDVTGTQYAVLGHCLSSGILVWQSKFTPYEEKGGECAYSLFVSQSILLQGVRD